MIPVCPTISGFAKLMIITSYLSDLIESTRLSQTSYALISGFKSNVATFGEFTRIRSSPSNCVSSPPLKKKVTCAYFCVSARRSCVFPCFDRYSPNVILSSSGGYATSTFGICASYCAMHTKVSGKYPFLRSNPVKSGSTNALVSCLARSGRKLKKITLSFSLIIPFLSTTVGSINSSVTSFA